MSDWQSIRGDAASLPTDPRNEIFEPRGIVVVAGVMWLGAVLNFLWGISLIWHSARINSLTFRVTGPAGSGQGYWLFMGLLSIVLGFIYVGLARGVRRGDPNSRQLAMIFAGINIVFGLFSFPGGLIEVILGGIVLWLLTRPATIKWFGIPRDYSQRPQVRAM